MNANQDVWAAEYEAMIASGLINNDLNLDDDPVGFGDEEMEVSEL